MINLRQCSLIESNGFLIYFPERRCQRWTGHERGARLAKGLHRKRGCGLHPGRRYPDEPSRLGTELREYFGCIARFLPFFVLFYSIAFLNLTQIFVGERRKIMGSG